MAKALKICGMTIPMILFALIPFGELAGSLLLKKSHRLSKVSPPVTRLQHAEKCWPDFTARYIEKRDRVVIYWFSPNDWDLEFEVQRSVDNQYYDPLTIIRGGKGCKTVLCRYLIYDKAPVRGAFYRIKRTYKFKKKEPGYSAPIRLRW